MKKLLTLFITLFFILSAAVYSQTSKKPPKIPTEEPPELPAEEPPEPPTIEGILKEIEQYTQEIKKNPKNERAYYFRSNSYMFLNEFKKAIADFNELIKLNPGEIYYYYLRGTAYTYNENYNSAIADFSTVIRMDSNFSIQNNILDLLSSYTFGLAVRQGNKMVRVEKGSFLMGSPANEPERINNEGPQHRVNVTGFYIGKFQVTQKEYREITGKNPSYIKGDNLPVENVSWYDAIEYCNALSRREGLTPAYTIDKTKYDTNNISDWDDVGWVVTWNRSANGYRLPTEAEWEYACRAGTTTPFYTGSNITTSQANYDGKYLNNVKGVYRNRTTGVGSYSFAPNPWGLYDMHGNVWEWCWDWFGDYSNAAQTDPVGPVSGSYRVARGGSYESAAFGLRSAARLYAVPNSSNTIGLRIVRSGK
jgi:formylglycine-generating enzyme required for sulfatase activity